MGRTEKSMKNIAFGVGAQAVTTLIHFLTKSIIARLLGAQIIAMNGLFTDVIACMSLAELGIGSAIVYNLYKPLAENDREKVSQLMTFFKQAYNAIALVIITIGVICSFFVQYIVKDITYPMWFIRTIFLLFVINAASSYLFSYKVSLLNADQKVYIYSFYSTIFFVVRTAIEIGVLFLLDKFGDDNSYIVYLCISIAIGVISNYLISKQVDKRYPYLKRASLSKEDRRTVFDNVKNIFVKEVSGKITSSTDNILISVMVSTIMVAPNQFYTMLTGVFKNVINQVEAGIKSSLGNLFATGSTKDCERVINRLTWGYGIFSVWACTGMFVCSAPFITVWVGAEFVYEEYILLIITINLFCYIISRPIYAAMHVAGLFKEGRNISIIGSAANLFVSIVFGYFWGIFGIFLGTFCTYFIQIVMKIYYVHKITFKTSAVKYSLQLTGFSVMLLAFMFGCRFVCSLIQIKSNLLQFIVNGAIVSVIYLVFVLVVFGRNENFLYFKNLVFEKLKKKHK